ncbi:MAG: HEPN domain-containing protein [Sedimentisphaerales bacterium]|nr:HEPN domain-containing protein [Sedimentisphaerales bacterium]
MNTSEQIQYWLNGSDEDISASQDLWEREHYRHAMYFAHLAIEKMLKAFVTKATQAVPPRTHNLMRLAQLGNVEFNDQQQEFIREFGVYQIEGRYPDAMPLPLDKETVASELNKTRELLSWLKKQL